ncbi:hypothetical protein WR25_06111 [Diploscapter pachys]|uniref:Uncharacterized protein n=1 Tax=Diploscapter pachys TaxID=2018661 RepID=A0A2A2LD37_9BILA|nr:hypothetical protein WR25_06111 [Diploscapter pachys]
MCKPLLTSILEQVSKLNNNKYRYDGVFDRFDGVHCFDNDSHHDLHYIGLYFVHDDIQFIDVHDDHIQ